MGNSTRDLQSVIDYAMTFPDMAPVFAIAGFSQQPSIRIANKVMTEMVAAAFNFKFNRMIVPPFQTISWQQDYATINLVNVGWLEHGVLVDINNTAFPKPIIPLEVVRDLERTSYQFGNPSQVCWLPNDQLVYATWGGGGQGDPGPLSKYTQPLGAAVTPANPFTQIIDSNGNIQILTTYGTTGAVQPAWPAAGAATGTTTNDGTCVWTVANPKACGFRVNPLPPQAGRVWQVSLVAQAKPPLVTTTAQLLDPIPDDYVSYFENGFKAYLSEHNPNPAIRARHLDMVNEWRQSLAQAAGKSDRERDAAGFYPATTIMDNGAGFIDIGPAYPYRKA